MSFLKKAMQGVQTNQTTAATSSVGGLEGLFANIGKVVQDVATEASKNMKICPECGAPNGADKGFCSNCGAKLPEETLAQGAVCPSCGKQNPIGTKFCQDCGTKLPIAVQEEQAAQARNEQVMADWDNLIPMFPKWNCGGSKFALEEYGEGYCFYATFTNAFEANNAVGQYRETLQQSGFQPAGQYPTQEHLYKMVNGRCFHVDLEHCFEGDSKTPQIYFDASEPYGGFNYTKPQQAPQLDLKNLGGNLGEGLKGLKGKMFWLGPVGGLLGAATSQSTSFDIAVYFKNGEKSLIRILDSTYYQEMKRILFSF